MGLVEDFILKIKQKEGFRFDGQVAEFMGIDRRVLANYKHSNNLPFKLQEWYCDKYDVKLKDFHEDIEITNRNINIKKEDGVVDARYIIDLQKDKIQNQTIEIEELKSALEHKEAESTHWDLLDFDFYVEIQLYMKNMKFSRVVNEVTNIEEQSKKLGYTVEKLKSLWDVGAKYNFDGEIPLKKILDQNTVKDINEKTKIFPAIFKTLKSIVGHHYIPIPVVYLHKKGNKIPAISYNKVKWSEMKVYSKVEYLKIN